MTSKNIETRLDRALQLEILRTYAEAHPYEATGKWQDFGDDEHRIASNLYYLKAHGLVTLRAALSSEGSFVYQAGTITEKGLDFVANDGGLSAILGVVTVRLHDDTIKELIEAKINASALAPQDKQKYLHQLRSLPADATKHLALKLIDLGIEKGLPTIAWLGTYLGQATLAGTTGDPSLTPS